MTKATSVGRIVSLPIGEIVPNPSQPRRRFEPEPLRALADSIAENGLLQPITVRLLEPGRYELVAGERRLEASKLAGRTEIAAIVIEADAERSASLALLENVQRADLTAFEQADAFQKLIHEHGLTQEQLAKRMGVSQPSVANKLRLLSLAPEVRETCEQGGLSERHARALLRLESSLRLEAAKSIARRRLNVQQTEQYIEGLIRDRKPKFSHRTELRDTRLFFNTVDKTVAAIRRMGIMVETAQLRRDNYVEYTIRLPVRQGNEVEERKEAVTR